MWLSPCPREHRDVGQKEYGRFEIHDSSHIVFEDLTHIRENIPEATWQHVWAFRRLYQYVEYNADDGGAPVDVRLNRGTLNVSGEYVPPASVEA